MQRATIMPLLMTLMIGCAAISDQGVSTAFTDPAGHTQITPAEFAQMRSRINHRVILVGDGGAPGSTEPVLDTLRSWSAQLPARTTVVYLGDNLYDAGLHASAMEDTMILRRQAEAGARRRIFVPGNHDWDRDGRDGAAVLLNQQRYLDSLPGATLMPKGGCPGPTTTRLAAQWGFPPQRGLVLITLDTQWWLMKKKKERRPACGGMTESAFIQALRDTLARYDADDVIVAAHHPLVSGGPHGHRQGLDRVYAFFAGLLGNNQDLNRPRYVALVDSLHAAMRPTRPLLYAAGHDHNLQVMTGPRAGAGGPRYHVVSGASSSTRLRSVRPLQSSLFSHEGPGFVVLDVIGQGATRRHVLSVVESGASTNPVFAIDLQ